MRKKSQAHDGWLSGKGEAGLVSVIIPVYNREDFIEDTLESVFQQTYRPIELVVVDDGSNDGTGNVVKYWVEDHASEDKFQINYMYQENAGAPAARNRGVKVSRGEYVQFLDSDDLLLQDKLSRGVELLQECGADMVYCRTTVRTVGAEDHVGSIGSKFQDKPSQIPKYTWHTSGPVYRRSMIRDMGPWLEELTGCQDWEFCARAKLFSRNIVFDARVGSVFRKHDQERISRKGVEFDYTRSAERAYDHIYSLAQKRGCLSVGFRARIARLYLFRALEYRNNGYEEEAQRCIRKVRRKVTRKNKVWWLATVCHHIPHSSLTRLLQKIIKVRNLVQRYV